MCLCALIQTLLETVTCLHGCLHIINMSLLCFSVSGCLSSVMTDESVLI